MQELNPDNAWLSVLKWLTHHFHLQAHPLQYLSGLPIEQGELDKDLFIRASEQANLQLSLVASSALGNASLPLVAIETQSNQPWIISARHDHQFTVLHYQTGQWHTSSMDEKTLRHMIEPTVWQVSVDHAPEQGLWGEEPRATAHWLWAVVKEVRPWYRDLLIASFIINVLALVVPLFTMNVYDRVVPNQAFSTLWVLVVGVSIVLLFDWLLREARSSVTDAAGRYIDNKLSAILFAKVMGMKLENRPQSAGAFARQLQDFDSVREFFTSVTLVTLIDLPFTLLFLLLIGWLGGAMMFIPLAIMALLLLLTAVMKGKIEQTHTETARLSTIRQAHLFDSLLALPEIKQNNAEGAAQSRWEQTTAQLSEWYNRSRHYSNVVTHTIQSSQQVVTICLIVLGVYQIAAGNLSMGGLIAIVMLSGRAAGAINQLSLLMLRVQQTKTAIQGLNSIMALPQERSEQQKLDAERFMGSVKLEAVDFTYPQAPMACLKGINLSIRAGERIGLIGLAGSGKSTLLALMAKQLAPTQGRIFFDQVDSQLWPTSLIRQSTGWMAQTPQWIQGTITDNIALGDTQVDKARLAQAIQWSGLMHYMSGLQQGLETQVGEAGRYLSGGQKQAVALARAFYCCPQLLILDEPTNALDKQAETQLFQSLQSMPRDISMVISSHKHAFLTLCDRIVVLDKGSIVAEGKPSEILASSSVQSTHRVRAVSIVRGGSDE
ncbi:type I secretion system permease/ATPase [Vibrio cholerae]|uniref:type I secretion system permease/ATPase n=1 Tax=Vibrio cholerae TaxID=666 RepID=UPI0004E2D32F|nr:type I secretion system permease/ATPase [Vibrio cholerae]MDF4532599.1 type I secretion system permease/ATPase [Vibrio parahaemolyticus]EGQ9105299.1 type I secretion system permease/ATPase [Vibrio cholerae]EGR1039300.1 type I secretion system permease/ATPase [Vibrio cholerae]EGR1089266.1 type I secretion system permease/ATPase [Vibrio cholerae]EGR4293728.1 type I secretion system permease/ATPase [Vibrio cholerae]